MRVVFGYALRHPDEQCAVDAAEPSRTLCGRDVQFLPVHEDGYRPMRLHGRCRELLDGVDVEVQVEPIAHRTGVCPDCGGEAQLDAAGMVAAHPAWVMRGGMQQPSGRPCAGAGQKPEAP